MGMDWTPVRPHQIQRQTTYKELHVTSYILQSNDPEDGLNYSPKYVELTLEF